MIQISPVTRNSGIRKKLSSDFNWYCWRWRVKQFIVLLINNGVEFLGSEINILILF